jgi:hypothetical protein
MQQQHLRKKEKEKNNSSNNKQLQQYPHPCWNNNKKIAEQAIRSFLLAPNCFYFLYTGI